MSFFSCKNNLVSIDECASRKSSQAPKFYYCSFRHCIYLINEEWGKKGINQQLCTPFQTSKKLLMLEAKCFSAACSNKWLMMMHLKYSSVFFIWGKCWFSSWFSNDDDDEDAIILHTHSFLLVEFSFQFLSSCWYSVCEILYFLWCLVQLF